MKKQEKLEKLKKKMEADETLPLKEGATNLVFGEGSPNAEVFFIGEGPGYWEDQKARPFVGNAGALLNQMLMTIDLPREEVYITNVINYRAPENRDPTEEEMKAFEPYVDGIIEIIEPKVIITLGRFSMAKFIPNVFISKVHGKPHNVSWKEKMIAVLPMYHPAAALRNGSIKRMAMEDFKIIPKLLNQIKEGGLESDKKKEEKKEKLEQMSLV